MSLEKFKQKDRLLVILRLLTEDSDYTLNTSILQSALEAWSHNISRDRVHADISWLAEQGLVSFDEMGSVLVVKITQRGLDVAQGRSQTLGVSRPGPGA